MESGFAARNGGRLGVAALAAILLLGLGLRVGEAWDGRSPVYDAAAYARVAANLEEGRGFTVGEAATQPSSNYSPGLPLLVAASYEATGGVHERVARLLLALIGTLAILFTYLIGRRLGRLLHYPPQGVGDAAVTAGLLGAAAVAVYPALLEYQGMLMGEPLAGTLLSGAVLAMFWAGDRAPERGAGSATGLALGRWLLPGVLLGALALTRPEYLAVAVLLAVLVALPRPRSQFPPHSGDHCDRGQVGGGWRRALGQAAALLVGVVLVVAPWTVRNAIALDRFVPISTGGGQVLFAGTYLPSDGNPERVGTEVVAENPQLFAPGAADRLRLEQILAILAADRFPELETDQALARMGREQLWDDLSGEPLEYAGFVATKVWRLWTYGAREVMEEPQWEALHWALLGFGLLGLGVLAWRRRWEALVLATVFVSITAISALLVASPRRLLVMLPLLAALTGLGATTAARWSRDRLKS